MDQSHECKLKHLELVQNVITRMGSNSLQLKGWSVILVSALFAIGANTTDPCLFALAYLPALAFWTLDSYFLRQERLFRKLYDDVRAKPDSDIDFSMDTKEFASQVQTWHRTAFSSTLAIFHGVIFAVITLAVAIATIAK